MKRHGITFYNIGGEWKHRSITATVTGEMSDGRKVWTECDEQENITDIDAQYFLKTHGGLTEFVRT